jgi:predicted RNase H-like HicB family nuclease
MAGCRHRLEMAGGWGSLLAPRARAPWGTLLQEEDGDARLSARDPRALPGLGSLAGQTKVARPTFATTGRGGCARRTLHGVMAASSWALGAFPFPASPGYAALMAEGTTLHLTAAITREGEWYVARCLDVEVASQGSTVEEAMANLREALELYFEDQPVPDEPPRPIVAPIDVHLRLSA